MNYQPSSADIRASQIPQPLLVSRSAAREKVRDALRLYVGRGRRYSVKELSNATGVADRAIECAMCDPDSLDYRQLPHEALLSIAKFLGASFASHYLELAGHGAYELMDEQPLPSVLTADSAKPAETPRAKVERLQRELFNAIEELTA